MICGNSNNYDQLTNEIEGKICHKCLMCPKNKRCKVFAEFQNNISSSSSKPNSSNVQMQTKQSFYKCFVCQITFNYKGTYQIHLRKHYQSKYKNNEKL